jgi:type IV pilus assembly protein PilY1
MSTKPLKNTPFRITAVGFACLTLVVSATSNAAPLTLTQIPPGGGGRAPAPHVIVTVDDSGSMGASGIAALKGALNNAFSSTAVPDDSVRVGYQAMWRCRGLEATPYRAYGTSCPDNRIRPLSGTHRDNFNTWINSLQASSTTPSHMMMKNAGEYMKTTGIWNPYAKDPGVTEAPLLSCRKSFHIFMTDGGWNSATIDGNDPGTVGNADGINRTLPDGVSYSLAPPTGVIQTHAYSDNFGAGAVNTLADYAFTYWATDLQPSIPDEVLPIIRVPSVVNFGTTASPYPIAEYWNPQNNPATWQHLVTYTIGFNAAAALPTTGDGYHPWWGGTTWSGSDYTNLVTGTVNWGDPINSTGTELSTAKKQELWHMAINSRGRFVPATNATELSNAFAEILRQINQDSSAPQVSIASSSGYLSTGLYAYTAGFASEKWAGSLTARALNASNATVASSVTWNAATLLDVIPAANLTNRFVMSFNGTAGFSWSDFTTLPTAQRAKLSVNSGGTADTEGLNRMLYLRGDRTNEGTTFRVRNSRLGDIVNSNIWYTGKPASGYSANGYNTFRSTGTGGKGGRTPMLYIGANDGMLHGFSAANWPEVGTTTVVGGQELLAYIPQGVAEGNLRKLTDIGYSHQYFVDGSPFTGDAYIGTTPSWTTVLVGTLGAGGKGYFILNVTDPAQFSVANASSLVITDTTASTDADLGVITSPPVVDDALSNKSTQIVQMNGGRWAAVMGNGYNSTNEAPVLIIQYLDGDKAIKKVSPCSLPTSGACSFKGSNGLSAPQLIDLNGDGKVDIAYAGDLKGNVWKFNLTSATDSSWSTSFSGQPMFVAQPSPGVTQAITAAPYWMAHPSGGVMVAVGTGRNLTLADQTSAAGESLYALWDNSVFTSSAGVVTITDTTAINTSASTSIPSTLVQQSFTGSLTDGGSTYSTSSGNAVTYPAKRGWYINWPIGGQRMLHNIRPFTGQKILIQSTVPKSGGAISNDETCTAITSAERTFLTVLNMFTGKPSNLSAFNLTAAVPSVTTIEIGTGDTIVLRTETGIHVVSSSAGGTGGGGGTGSETPPVMLNPGKFIGMRANWREIQ